MWFYDPLYLRDKDDLTPGITHTFSLAGLCFALRKALLVFYPQVERMHLRDFKVRVINSGGTASVVRVLIESTDGGHVWTTTGVSSNIIQACLVALQDSLTYFLTFVA